MAINRQLPDPASEPMITVERAARILGISCRSGYYAVDRGDWPLIRQGRPIRVDTARFLAQYGLDDPPAASM